MKPTSEQVQGWFDEWDETFVFDSWEYVAQRAAQWAASQSAERIAVIEAENAQLRHDNHNLNWALGTDGYPSMATAEEQAEAEAAQARVMKVIENMKARKDIIERQQERIAELERQREKLLGALEFMLEVAEPPPERNCRCHISPPCNDCVDYGGLRDAFKQARAAIAEVRGEK